jgi:hypothetical protein
LENQSGLKLHFIILTLIRGFQNKTNCLLKIKEKLHEVTKNSPTPRQNHRKQLSKP